VAAVFQRRGEAFVTTSATVYGSRCLQFFGSKTDSVSPFLDATTRNPSNLCAAESSALGAVGARAFVGIGFEFWDCRNNHCPKCRLCDQCHCLSYFRKAQ
jgi:hypothetical protein